LLWLDAATLDKAVAMKINFYAAHLDKTDWGSRAGDKLADKAAHDRPLSLRTRS
jgi:hypothetical protein